MKRKEIKKDIGTYQAIEALGKTEGGQIIITTLKKDLTDGLYAIASKYKTGSYAELIAIGAGISKTLNMLRTFTNAPKNKKLAADALIELGPDEE